MKDALVVFHCFCVLCALAIIGIGIWMTVTGITGDKTVIEIATVKISTTFPGLVVVLLGFLAFRFTVKRVGEFFYRSV